MILNCKKIMHRTVLSTILRRKKMGKIEVAYVINKCIPARSMMQSIIKKLVVSN